MSLSLLVADDHQMMRMGLSAALERRTGFGVVAQVSSGAEAVVQVGLCQPDIAIVDVRLPDMSGFEVCTQILAGKGHTAVLLIATHDWDINLAHAYQCGAAGFLAKVQPLGVLIASIEQIARGQSAYTESQLRRVQWWQTEVHGRLAALTSREQDVFWALAQGYTNSEVAQQLHISSRTVESHVSHVLQKLELESRRQVRRWAAQNHLLAFRS